MGATSQLPARPRGIALLMALAVVMLLTVFMSEYFFATGLELRAMTTYREAQQARSLAKAVFKVAQIGMFQDEVDFFKGYRQVAELLQFAAVPWADGLLISLEIAPQDHLYNVNQLSNLRPDEPSDRGRSILFSNTIAELEIPGESPETEPQPLSDTTIAELYAALMDWIDAEDDTYIAILGVQGAEADAYLLSKPEYTIKNGMIDRLTEIRLVRGVGASRIPWGEWEARFAALPRTNPDAFYFTEKINVNLASQQEITEFLENRRADPNDKEGFQGIQKGINEYADKAGDIAAFFVPEEGDRDAYNLATLLSALKEELGLNENYAKFLLSTVNRYTASPSSPRSTTFRPG
ncbi:MAG: general secretion pathway protein GspK [SAR324 cluster bacterium]|nr:general secretion pathway protein GspK [SAR324 cluster bacterium]